MRKLIAAAAAGVLAAFAPAVPVRRQNRHKPLSSQTPANP